MQSFDMFFSNFSLSLFYIFISIEYKAVNEIKPFQNANANYVKSKRNHQ